MLIGAVGGGAALVLVVVAILLAAAGGGGSTATTTTAEDPGAIVIADVPPAPSSVSVAVAGDVATVSWTASASKPGDSYLVARVGEGYDANAALPATGTSLLVQGIEVGAKPCFKVYAVRSGSQSAEASPTACAP